MEEDEEDAYETLKQCLASREIQLTEDDWVLLNLPQRQEGSEVLHGRRHILSEIFLFYYFSAQSPLQLDQCHAYFTNKQKPTLIDRILSEALQEAQKARKGIWFTFFFSILSIVFLIGAGLKLIRGEFSASLQYCVYFFFTRLIKGAFRSFKMGQISPRSGSSREETEWLREKTRQFLSKHYPDFKW